MWPQHQGGKGYERSHGKTEAREKPLEFTGVPEETELIPSEGIPAKA